MTNTRIGELITEHLFAKNQHYDPQLTAWLDEDPLNKQLLKEYEKIWNEVANCGSTVEFDANVAWAKINQVNHHKEIRKRRLQNIGAAVLGLAASILLFIGLYFSGYINKNNPSLGVSVVTKYGNRSEIVLPDGTKVKLNAGTTVHYVENETKHLREVIFQGEAFFDVAKSEVPFVIHTPGDLQIRVLGTTFSLCAYADDQTVTTSLLTGSVELSHADTKRTLAPGEVISYDKASKEMKLLDSEIAHTYDWLNHKLYMDSMSLTTVCKNLERSYDVQITLGAQLGESIHYTGVLQEENIVDILNALCSLSKIKYEMNGRNILITSK